MAFDDLIKKSPPGGAGLVVLEDYNYTMIDGMTRRIEINYVNKTIIVTGESKMKQEWIVDRFRDIYKLHQKSGNPSPFNSVGKYNSVGKIAELKKDWSVGIDYGNGTIHKIGRNIP
jgi:hypothetical protein